MNLIAFKTFTPCLIRMSGLSIWRNHSFLIFWWRFSAAVSWKQTFLKSSLWRQLLIFAMTFSSKNTRQKGLNAKKHMSSDRLQLSLSVIWMFRSKALLLVVCSQWLKGKMAPIRITARQRDSALKTTSVYHLCLGLRRNESTSRFIPLKEEPLL